MYIVSLPMVEDGDIKAHIYDFTARKQRVEEHGIVLMDITYCTFFIVSMLMMY